MAKFVENQSNFSAGVLSRKLYGRTDINEYRNGLSVGDNALIAKEGGAYKRFSSLPIMQLGNDNDVQIESVVNSTNQIIFILCTGTVIYLYNSRGHKFSGPHAMVGDTGQYSVAMMDDTIYITHYNGNTRPWALKIVESSLGVLSAEIGSFGDDMFSRPMSSPNTDLDKKIRAVGTSTTNAEAVQIESTGFNLQDEFVVDDIIMITGVCLVKNAYRISTFAYRITSFASPTLADVLPFNVYTGSTTTTYDALSQLVHNTGAGYAAQPKESLYFDEWSYTLWGPNRGWPRMLAVDEGRLIAAGTTDLPSTIWGSQTNNPTFFLDRRFTHIEGVFAEGSVGIEFKTNSAYQGDILETDPYNFTLSTKNGSQITFMESSTVFVVGTSRQEFIISGDGATVSQKNISVRPHTSHGAMINNSLTFDNAVLFVARNQRQIHLFRYNQENGSYITQEVSILNDEVFEEDPIKSMSWNEQIGVAFIVTSNGNLVTLTLGQDTDTKAFTFHDIGGTVIDVAAGYEDEEDYMAIVVQRNGRTYLEKLSKTTVLIGGSAGSSLDYSRLAEAEINYLDGGAVLDFAVSDTESLGIVGSARYVDRDGDYIQVNISDLKIGDQITFRSNLTDGDIWPGMGINLDTAYYIIPFEGSGDAGVQLATSLANAQTGTQISFAGIGGFYVRDDATLYYEVTRDNQNIPTRQFANGTELKAFRYDVSTGEKIEEDFTADGSATYDLGGDFSGQAVAYGLNYEFHIATMPIEAGQQWGSAQLGLKRIDKLLVRTYETKSFTVSADGYNSEEVSSESRLVVGNPASPIIPESARYEIPFTADNEYDQVVHIQNDKPEAVYIASLTMRGVSNDG
jgi:hypothetical protein